MTPPAATAAARRSSTAPRPAPTRPRRVSGPVAVPRRRTHAPAGARALAWVRGLPDHRLLDRLIGGRIWIVLLGTLLVGLVTLQLTMLKLNAGIGRAVERSAQLEQRNAVLQASISKLGDSSAIMAEATRLGMVMPDQGTPRFVSASADDARTALVTMRVPSEIAPVTPVTPVVTADSTAVTDTTATPADQTAGTTATTDPATTTTTPDTDGAATATGTTTTQPTTTTTDPTATTAAGGAAAPTQG